MPHSSTSRDIAALFAGPIEPVRASPAYVLGLAITSLAMLLLPLLYLALIALVGWLVYLHATGDTALLDFAGKRHIGRAAILPILLYLAPIFAGAILLTFMVKPLFARRGRHNRPYTIEPSQEPRLYAFAAAVADAIGAPRPWLIEVTCDVNAAASFRRGWLSLFRDDLVLTIGMPLAAGMDTRQLAGVIAHELGHFSQRAAMRFTFLIDNINRWFARIVYERDAFDERLEEWSHTDNGFAALVVAFSRLCVWLTRRILVLFMLAGRLMSCFLSREMEYNADMHEVRLAGSACFEQTSRRIRDLAAASHHLTMQLSQQLAARRLSEDFPSLIVATVPQMPARVRAALDAAESTRRTRFFDTHPATRDRIARAAAENTQGVFQLEKPAASLFKQFAVLCKWVSVGHYQQTLGVRVSVEQLVPVQKIVVDQQVDSQSAKALSRYTQGLFHLELVSQLSPTLTDQSKRPQPACDELVKQLRAARRRFELLAPAAQRESKTFDEAQNRLFELRQARRLARSGIAPPGKMAHLPMNSPGAIQAACQRAEQEASSASTRLAEVCAALRRRWSLALRLLAAAETATKIDQQGKLARHAERLTASLRTLQESLAAITELASDSSAWQAVVMRLVGGKVEERVVTVFDSINRDLHRNLTSLQSMLRDQAYPLERSGEPISIAAWAIDHVPHISDPGALGSAASEASDRLVGLVYRVVARLAMIAQKVEKAWDMPPLELPASGDREATINSSRAADGSIPSPEDRTPSSPTAPARR